MRQLIASFMLRRDSMMIVRRLPSTPNAQKAGLIKDVTTLSHVNAVDNDDGTDGSDIDRLLLPGDAVEFTIRLVVSKTLRSCRQAAAALTLSAITGTISCLLLMLNDLERP